MRVGSLLIGILVIHVCISTSLIDRCCLWRSSEINGKFCRFCNRFISVSCPVCLSKSEWQPGHVLFCNNVITVLSLSHSLLTKSNKWQGYFAGNLFSFLLAVVKTKALGDKTHDLIVHGLQPGYLGCSSDSCINGSSSHMLSDTLTDNAANLIATWVPKWNNKGKLV